MTLRSIIVLSCFLSLYGCAGGPRWVGGTPFGLPTFGSGIAIGSVLTILPHRHVVLDEHTYYADGDFYKNSPCGYLVVAPPLGMWVDNIAEEHRIIRHKDQDYFTSKGAWYRFDVQRKQYQVVEEPFDRDDD